MNLEQVMTRGVRTCRPDESLNRAAQIMWDHDCGCVAVVDADGRAIAMITDRDICMAAYTQGRRLDEIQVSSAASQGVVAVRVTDTLEAAETLMRKHRVRRLPVLDDDGRPIGILSMTDLARRARVGHRHGDLNADTIVRTLAAVCEPKEHIAAAE